MELNTRNSRSFIEKKSRQSIDKNGLKIIPTKPEERLSNALKKLIEINDKTKRKNAIKISEDMEEEKKKNEMKKKLPNIIHNVLLMKRAKKNFEKNADFDESKKENDLPSNSRYINSYNDVDASDDSGNNIKYSDIYNKQDKINKNTNSMNDNDNNDNTKNNAINGIPNNLTWENMISHRTPYASSKKAKKERQLIISKLRTLQKEKNKDTQNPIQKILISRGPKEKTENEISGENNASHNVFCFLFCTSYQDYRIKFIVTFYILLFRFIL